MTQQQISTPSVVDIEDSKILSSNAYGSLGIAVRDPWNSVLSALEIRSLDPATVVAGMDNAVLPSTVNPFITRSFLDMRMENRGLILIGPAGSDADFPGDTDTAFTDAIASLPSDGGRIGVLAGTYTFSSTVTVPKNVYIIGLHPISVIIQGVGNIPVFDLTGESSRIDYITLENPDAVSEAVVNLTGLKSSIFGCQIQNFPLLGIRLTGSKSFVSNCRISSDSSAIWFQGFYQSAICCSFAGFLSDGVLRFETSECSALSNFIHDTVTGPSFIIPSPSCVNNKLVSNHLGTSIAVAASTDYGTKSVRYANTPDTFQANENNFLVALQSYTGQPNLDSTEMVLSNHLAHDTSVDKDAASILSSLDLFVQRIYEERSWYLTSDDPVFDVLGVPTFGVFTWTGTILTWPDFAIRSLVSSATWTISASSSPISAGECLVVDIDRTTPGGLTPTIKTKPITLENPIDANQYVLAFSPITGMLIWTQGFKIFINLTALIIPSNQIQTILSNIQVMINASSGDQTFDIDGMYLPITRYVGVPTDPRNTPVMPSSFAIGDDITEKLGSQSSLLKSLYEKTNLWEYSDASIDTFPTAGDWLDLTSNQPETPSHLVQVKGTTYALFPNFGLYRWYRVQPGDNPGIWGALVACPSVGPFASLSLIGTDLAILTCAGTIVTWSTDFLTWSTITPSTSLSLPFPNTRPVGYLANGQSDFIFQTPYYSVFTLMDGRSILYFQSLNSLVECPKIFTETPKGQQLLGRHFKDSGFNVARENPWIDTSSNGCYSTLEGLPLSSIGIPTAFEIPAELWSPSLATIKWETLKQESFSFDANSGSFLDIAYTGATYYVLGGGLGWSKLFSIVTIGTTPGFTDFSAHGWLTDISNGEIIVFGSTVSNSEFTIVHGKMSSGFPCWSWTRSVLGGVNSCKGSVGVLDRWYNYGSGNAHILVSDLARSSRPTWWTFFRASATWSSVTLSEFGGGGSYIIPQAVAGSFTYDANVDRQAAYGVASMDRMAGVSASSIRFLVRDMARSGRPTQFEYNGTVYTGIRLSEGVLPADVIVSGADGNSMTQVYGGVYQKAWDAVLWTSRESSGNQIKLFFHFESANTWSSMSVGLAGTYLNTLSLGTPTFQRRSGTLVAESLPTEFIAIPTAKDIFVWTQTAGLLKGSITAHYLTGISSASWTQIDKRVPTTSLPIFPTDTLATTYSPSLAGSRCDISIQIGSLAEKTMPVFGSGLSPAVGSLFWFETGTKVRQLTSTIWSGLNRNGYLWIGNPLFGNHQQELTPNPATVRGDITVTNLGYTDDYDYAFNGTGSQIAFVYKDLNNANRLGFILYDIASNSVTHERGGFSGVVPLGSTPQIAYNGINNSWSIVAQDATIPTSNAKLMFFRRLVVSPTWIEESALSSGSGKLPAKPIHHTDGSIIVVTESGASYNALVSIRTHATSIWSSIYITSGGGFRNPKFIKTLDGLMFWIFGGIDSTARVAWSSSPLSGWSIWSGTVTLNSVGYSRISSPTLLPLASSVVVASATTADGLIPANREMLIWRFENTGSVKCIGCFTAKGRLQATIYSSDEEDGITDLSWTPDQKLLYGATRPTRTSLHWSLRGSTQSWNVQNGESLLGSGRYITLGDRHFREQWGAASATGGGLAGQDLIIEYPNAITTWSSLPLAQREGETDFTGIKWPYLTSSGRLFTKGSPSAGFTDDTGLPTGTLVASASRDWPIILGNTRWSGNNQVGPSVFSQGAMLGLYCPIATTNLAYFGTATVGSNGLFKINALAVLTFNGTRTWSVSPSKQYVLVGPVTYEIDTTLGALGSHLVLEFNTAGSLTLDAMEIPLSYWTAIDHSLTAYAVVVGEIREQAVLLYPAIGSRSESQLLQFGNMEPIELSSTVKEWTYALPYKIDISPLYEIISTSSSSFALKETGSLRGIQPLSFTAGIARQIFQRRQLPMSGCFLNQTNENVASSSRIDSLVAMLPTSILVVDHVSGGSP